jgi:hypothetical protein
VDKCLIDLLQQFSKCRTQLQNLLGLLKNDGAVYFAVWFSLDAFVIASAKRATIEVRNSLLTLAILLARETERHLSL